MTTSTRRDQATYQYIFCAWNPATHVGTRRKTIIVRVVKPLHKQQKIPDEEERVDDPCPHATQHYRQKKRSGARRAQNQHRRKQAPSLFFFR